MAIAVPVTDESLIGTYAQLIDRVVEHTDGRVTVAKVPTFIRLAEAEMNRRLAKNPVRPMQCREAITISAQTQAMPANYMKTDSMYVVEGGKTYPVRRAEIENIDARQINHATGDEFTGTVNTRPTAFAEASPNLLFYPTPTQSWAGHHTYYKRLTPLSDSAATNWLLNDHPDAYFFGTLAFAYHSLPDMDATDSNMQLFDAIMSNVLEAYPKTPNYVPLRTDLANYIDRNSLDYAF